VVDNIFVRYVLGSNISTVAAYFLLLVLLCKLMRHFYLRWVAGNTVWWSHMAGGGAL